MIVLILRSELDPEHAQKLDEIFEQKRLKHNEVVRLQGTIAGKWELRRRENEWDTYRRRRRAWKKKARHAENKGKPIPPKPRKIIEWDEINPKWYCASDPPNPRASLILHIPLKDGTYAEMLATAGEHYTAACRMTWEESKLWIEKHLDEERDPGETWEQARARLIKMWFPLGFTEEPPSKEPTRAAKRQDVPAENELPQD